MPNVGTGGREGRIRATVDLNEALAGVAEVNAVIDVLEPPAEAHTKIGVNGQWIKVRTLDGTEGFTAAWLYMLIEV